MPLEGLPSSLEAMLTTLLMENVVNSFKIDVNDNRTVVILRLSSTTGDQHGGATSTSSATFKRKTASQIERDRQRAQQFQQQQLQQQNQHRQQPLQHQHQASDVVQIDEHSLPTSLFTSQDAPLGLPTTTTHVVNPPRRRPVSSRANREKDDTHQIQQPTRHGPTEEEAHEVIINSNFTQQECVPKQHTTPQHAVSKPRDGEDGGEVDSSTMASIKDSVSHLLEQLNHQQQQTQQLQQQHHRELTSRYWPDSDRPPPPRYHLRSYRE